MSNSYAVQAIEELKKWVKDSKDNIPLKLEILSGLRSMILRSIYDQSHVNADWLLDQFTPIAANLRQWNKGIAMSRRQGVEICSLVNILRGAVFIMEKDDPKSAARLIKHGETILDILVNLEDADLKLRSIQKKWPGGNAPPSESTISRILGSLEESGFVERQGATKGRKIRLLAKARHWQELKEKKPADKQVVEDKTSADSKPSHLENSVFGGGKTHSAPAKIISIHAKKRRVGNDNNFQNNIKKLG